MWFILTWIIRYVLVLFQSQETTLFNIQIYFVERPSTGVPGPTSFRTMSIQSNQALRSTARFIRQHSMRSLIKRHLTVNVCQPKQQKTRRTQRENPILLLNNDVINTSRTVPVWSCCCNCCWRRRRAWRWWWGLRRRRHSAVTSLNEATGFGVSAGEH